jgi:hypothetical protein
MSKEVLEDKENTILKRAATQYHVPVTEFSNTPL